jgi:hypothetical protein
MFDYIKVGLQLFGPLVVIFLGCVLLVAIAAISFIFGVL